VALVDAVLRPFWAKLAVQYTKTFRFRTSFTLLQLNIERAPAEIPVFFHDLKGYDSHMIVSEVGKHTAKLTAIPQNFEKLISLMPRTPADNQPVFELTLYSELVAANFRRRSEVTTSIQVATGTSPKASDCRSRPSHFKL
jgi:hypothetical protein